MFTATQGLKTAWNSPLDERGIIGMAMGIAFAGGKPVAEIQFCDYIFNVIDLLKLCGNIHWSSAGEYHLPLVVMTNRGTAAAAEVAAAALQGNKRATLVGERTYGDASVRRPITMEDGSAIILSVAKY